MMRKIRVLLVVLQAAAMAQMAAGLGLLAMIAHSGSLGEAAILTFSLYGDAVGLGVTAILAGEAWERLREARSVRAQWRAKRG